MLGVVVTLERLGLDQTFMKSFKMNQSKRKKNKNGSLHNLTVKDLNFKNYRKDLLNLHIIPNIIHCLLYINILSLF